VPDPIVFNDDLRVTIQQIGAHTLQTEDEFNEYVKTNPPAGTGPRLARRVYAWGIFERVDDYCAVDFVYCREPQAVVPLDVAAALADIDRRDYESAHPLEGIGS
jgi:hypothetical protein